MIHPRYPRISQDDFGRRIGDDRRERRAATRPLGLTLKRLDTGIMADEKDSARAPREASGFVPISVIVARLLEKLAKGGQK